MSTVTIKLLLYFADTKRLRVAEVSTRWNVALAAPRFDLDALLEREELERAGVYVLLAPAGEGGLPTAYIGEAETVRDRLKQHRDRKDWTSVLVFTSTRDELTKAHIRCLEGRLIEDATAAGRYKVLNAQPSGAKLRESDRADLNEYLFWLKQLLPILGCDLVERSEGKTYERAAVDRSAAKLSDAFRVIETKITAKHRELLAAHYEAPERKITARQMAKKVGWTSFAAANLHYGRLGRLLGKALGLPDDACSVEVLVAFIPPRTEGNAEWIWLLRPEVTEALEQLGWVGSLRANQAVTPQHEPVIMLKSRPLARWAFVSVGLEPGAWGRDRSEPSACFPGAHVGHRRGRGHRCDADLI